MNTRNFFLNKYIKGGLLILAGLFLGRLFFHQHAPRESTEKTTSYVHEHQEGEKSVWTCSMHPQIKMERPGSCPICGMDLIPIENQYVGSDSLAVEMSESAIKLAQVQTSVVGKGRPSKEIRLFGKIRTDERLLQSQTAHVPGRIEQLLINVTGEPVKKGQLIAKIYSPELIAAQKELLEALSMQNRYPAVAEAVKEKLRNWKLNENQIGEIEQSGKITSTFDLYANTTGIVTSRAVNTGDYVSTGTVLFEVAGLSKVWAVFDAYESDLPWISMNQPVEFTTQAIPGKNFEGRISFIDPVIDPSTRIARVRAELNNPGLQLKPGMFINGNLKQKNRNDNEQLVIPQSAVLWTGTRSAVYVKMPGTETPSFKMREITLGPSTKDAWVVLEGLSEGDEIVTNGAFSVDAAAQLSGKPSMMNPQGGEHTTGHRHDPTHTENQPKEQQQPNETDPAFRLQLTEIYKAYLNMKDAFVASDAQKVKTTARDVKQKIEKTDMKLLKGDAHIQWMDQLSALLKTINSISKLSDIRTQRTEFIRFNAAFYESLKKFGLKNVIVYSQYCPMANSDKGAWWFSSSEEIRNPYFGEDMLTCGETKEILNFK
ncbi:MAG: efflux RND transporter periplasmic adaptor subunit [Prolixibacteraceae bacterium]